MADPCLLPSACHDGIGTPDYIAFAAQYLACTRRVGPGNFTPSRSQIRT